MKVSLITLHRIVNYGSVLQAYATQQIFEQLGAETEVVDYFIERMTQRGMSVRIRHKHPLLEKSALLTLAARAILYPSYRRRFRVFRDFVNRNIKMTPHIYSCWEDFKKYPIEADCYWTGSDQTWNSLWNEKLDAPFYLSYAPDDKPKFSYGASFGRTALEDWEIEPTKRLLSRYRSISVREASGVEILRSLSLDGTQVLDPTLLLTAHDWQPLISDKYAKHDYIFVYNANHEKGLEQIARRLAREKKLPIYFMSYHFHDFYKKGKLICCPEVEDFLGLIAHANYVVTDSFHCMAFAMNFRKQLMVYYPERFRTRLESLVELTGQQNRVVQADSPLSAADEPIDFAKISEILDGERAKALDYIRNALAAAAEKDEIP